MIYLYEKDKSVVGNMSCEIWYPMELNFPLTLTPFANFGPVS